MEINKYLDIFGGLTKEAMYEGRFVVLGDDFTDDDGVYGATLPSSSAQALLVGGVVAWPPTNVSPPYYTPTPSLTFALRQGFDQAANDPFDAQVDLIHPTFRKSSAIPSGTLVRIFNTGAVVTLFSGEYVSSTSLVKGAAISVNYTGANAGKAQYDASGTIGIVEEIDSTNFELTVRLK